jgi:hypothetical protein
MDALGPGNLAKGRANLGYAVVGALILKATFKLLERSSDSFSDTTVTALQVLALLASVAVFGWLARTAFLCATAVGWAAWKCWCTAVACGVLQWVAWIMYFVFRSQVAKRIASSAMPAP